MSISIHIPFYNPNPEKKEGHRNLRRFDYLKENIENLKTLSIKNDIFVHTHNEFLDDKKLDARIIKHQINDNDLDKGYLTWKCRSLMEEQKSDYEYFSYLEHDIKFSETNLQYWLKYQEILAKKNFHLGFFIFEKSNADNQNYSIHMTKKLDKFFMINNQKFIVNDFENYCCFWIYTRQQFQNFLSSKWWTFKKRAHNFRFNYGITERAAIGYHGLSMNYFRATLIPELNGQPIQDSFIEHMTNNYYGKRDLREVCKFKTDNIFVDTDQSKEVSDNFKLKKNFKSFLWKFRFITRKLN